MTRHQAREALLSLIYEANFPTEADDSAREIDCRALYRLAADCREIEPDSFVEEIFFDLPNRLSEIDRLIFDNANGWKADRLSRVSLSIMRLCTYEMLYRSEIPFNISIDEAVELAKEYDHDKAYKFINGVLNSIAEQSGLKAQ